MKKNGKPTAIQVAEKLARQTGDRTIALAVARWKRRARQQPLRPIIEQVPGKTLIERAKLLGVSRQAMARWFDGTARPTGEHAKRIAELTGVAEHIIRGQEK